MQVPVTSEGYFQATLSLYNEPMGPLGLPLVTVVNPIAAPGMSMPMIVWAIL